MTDVLKCRGCGDHRLTQVLDLGEQCLSDFRDDDRRPPRWPLQLCLCEGCGLVQLSVTAPRADMYHDGYGFYSGVNESIRAELHSLVRQALHTKPDAKTWLDIGCNDGTLLSYVPENIYRVCVDPVEKFAGVSQEYADVVISNYFDPTLRGISTGPNFDVITSSFMFYDLDDPNLFVANVLSVLAQNGIWLIEQNYVPAMLMANSVDNICHEHITYWSLTTMQKLLDPFGLEIIHASTSPVNGGAIRTLVRRKGESTPDPVVRTLLQAEAAMHLDRAETYWQFAERVRWQLASLRRLVTDAAALGRTCYIYAASTRGAVLWQAAGLDRGQIPFAVERNPDKVGKMFSAVGVPIISEEQARKDQPDYMLVGPWWFRNQVIEREREYLEAGGRLVFPLPQLEIIGVETAEVEQP